MYKNIDAGVDWFIVFADPFTQWLRGFLIRIVLIPMRDAYLWLPYSAVLVLVAGFGWMVGARRSALVCLAFIGLIAMTGWWDRAMITAYMVSFSVIIACAIGLPLGIWASRNEFRAKSVLLVCDTAQTFPSFIYLIPVVMLFGVNDVAAIGAVIIFGLVPMTRYTIEGLRSRAARIGRSRRHVRREIPSETLECPNPHGVADYRGWVKSNGDVFAFHGDNCRIHRNPGFGGQEMQRALSSTDVGKGLVLGFCVAFMG